MSQDPAPQDDEREMRFGLAIIKTASRVSETLKARAFKEGLPEPEIIVVVETWLEMFKAGYKAGIADAF